MNQPVFSGRCLVFEEARAYRGMIHGAQQASLLAGVRLAEGSPGLGKLVTALGQLAQMAEIGAPTVPTDGQCWAYCLGRIAALVDHFLVPVGIAIAGRTRVMQAAPDDMCNTHLSVLQVPVTPGSPKAALGTLEQITELIDMAVSDAPADDLALQLANTRSRAALGHQTTSTVLNLLRGAAQLRIPCTMVAPGYYQFGQGSRSRWFHSTLSDRTPGVSMMLARDKMLCSARLRQAGLPVPVQQSARSADHAVQLAAQIGYPVVIKPVDQDQGRGVTADLQSEAEVRKAWQHAASESRNILIEKHVAGRDYRLIVHDGELLWAIERVPAGITGDGKSTVAQLVEHANADPRRGTARNSQLASIKLDDEARILLDRQKLTYDAVPETDRFVRLSRIANVSRGGVPRIVNDEVHPDNCALAINAAAALRLDIAGIDLLIPNIAAPWHDSGGAICEVNAGPQFGSVTAAHLGGELIARCLESDGRIPVIAVLGDGPEGCFASDLAGAMAKTGLRAGHHDKSGVWLDGKPLLTMPIGAFAAGEMLLTNRLCDAAIISFNDDDPLANGLAADRIDWVIVAGTHLSGDAGGAEALRERYTRLLLVLAAQCTGTLAVLTDAQVEVPGTVTGGGGMLRLQEPITRADAINRIVSQCS